MANEEQVAILKQGVKAWNQWRQDNPDAVIDLSRIDLSNPSTAEAALLWHEGLQENYLTKTDLLRFRLAGAKEANLEGAHLEKADLTGAILTFAYLKQVILTDANLMMADLRGAYLGGADLSMADLREAKLREADLTGADLSKTDLRRADLRRADLRRAYLLGSDLRKADMEKAHLEQAYILGADLTNANMTGAKLWNANLTGAKLRETDLTRVSLRGADLTKADLRRAKLRQANLTGTDLSGTILEEAKLLGCDLTRARFVDTHLEGATLSDCRIYGMSAWNVFIDENTVQTGLIITPENQPAITVDNLKVAQFLYLLINNKEIANVIDTIRSKVVLILGRFDDNNKPRLDRLREALSSLRDEKGEQRYIPVMFDFDKPDSTNFMEPVVTLAHMSRFIIADFTDPKVVLAELREIYGPATIPLLPLLREVAGEQVLEPSTLPDIRRNNRWIMNTHRYANDDELLDQVNVLVRRAEKHPQRVAEEIKRSERVNDED